MKKLIALLPILLLLSSCSERLHVSSDYDKTIDFSAYKTFAWAREQEKPGRTNPMFDNELNRKRIKEAIEKELTALGMTRFDWAPHLLIDFHITIDDRVNYAVHDYYPFGFRYWPEYDVTSQSYKKGALIIHLVDTKKEQLVWQGIGSKTLDELPPENVEERIQKAVKSILAQYPLVNKK